MKAKSFFVLILCMFMLLLFAGGMVSESDLTPGEMAATQAVYSDMSLQQAPAVNVGSRCYSPYLVKAGDTLSEIARACGISLNEMIAANPGLAHPDRIYINQELHIPNGAQPGANPLADTSATAAAQQEAAAAGTLTSPDNALIGVLTSGNQAAPAPATAIQSAPASPTTEPGMPGAAKDPAVDKIPTAGGAVPGVRVGESTEVEINGLSANQGYRLEYGTSGGRRFPLGDVISDAGGTIKLTITIPPEARPGEEWFVFAFSLTQPGEEFRSASLQIGE